MVYYLPSGRPQLFFHTTQGQSLFAFEINRKKKKILRIFEKSGNFSKFASPKQLKEASTELGNTGIAARDQAIHQPSSPDCTALDVLSRGTCQKMAKNR